MLYLGRVEFADGSVRNVLFDENNGRQFVLTESGHRLYGDFIEAEPPDTPIVVEPEMKKTPSE